MVNEKLDRITLGILLMLLLGLTTAVPALAQGGSSKPIVIHAANHDISPPLSEMAAHAPALPSGGQHIVPLRPTPPLPGAGALPVEDPVLQRQSLPLVATINELNFDGISADGVAPPDTTGAVGDNVTNQYVQMVN